jgi:hypothetical protein
MTGTRAPSDASIHSVGEVPSTGERRERLTRSAAVWMTASVIIGAVLAILLHAIVGSFVVVANELSFGVLGRTLGAEVVASIWALLAFSGSAYVFYRYHTTIRGAGMWKGLRYGSAIALLWLVGMLEGVALFGNPIHAEFLVGLSDAVPVLIMSILLGVFVFRSGTVEFIESGRLRAVPALLTITLVFLAGRYLGYVSGIIGTGHSEYPVQTFVWTMLMGLSAGVAFLLLWHATLKSTKFRSAAEFGFWIFGVNWIVFMAFIPMLFEGVIVDIMVRVSLDIVVVILGCYAALRWWKRPE